MQNCNMKEFTGDQRESLVIITIVEHLMRRDHFQNYFEKALLM